MWKKRNTHQDTTVSRGQRYQTPTCTSGSQERLMSFNVKADVAECYRRAEEYKKLYHSASNLDEREMYLSTVRQFLRLAKDLEEG
jgi:hypothetical protein